jgi:methionine-rich copper-binding protein CopC
VAITSPSGGEVFLTAGGSLALTATASAPFGTVSTVAFYSGATKIADATWYPAGGEWIAVWMNIAPGLYAVTATAMDSFGLAGTSTPPVMIQVFGAPPTVAITSPSGGKVYLTAGGSLALTATASAPFGTVSTVAFYNGATKIGDATWYPAGGEWIAVWTNIPQGIYAVTAMATDSFGLTCSSTPPVMIQVFGPPSVAITSPTSTFVTALGCTVTFAATASTTTPGASIASVQFYESSMLLGSGVFDSGSDTWTCAWNTAGAAFGMHFITAQATDNGGLTGEWTLPTEVYVAVPGDGNLDGIVDGKDYGVWQNGYGHTASFATGDYNGDGVVDGKDYGVWQNNYGRSAAYSSGDTVVASGDETTGTISTPMAAAPTASATAALEVAPPASVGNAPRLIAMTPAPGAVVSSVTSVALVFDSDVQASAAAVEVNGLATGEHSDFAQAYDAATRTLTLTWEQALPADVYTVRVIGSFVVGVDGGAALDGAGNGTSGSDANLVFTAK